MWREPKALNSPASKPNLNDLTSSPIHRISDNKATFLGVTDFEVKELQTSDN